MRFCFERLLLGGVLAYVDVNNYMKGLISAVNRGGHVVSPTVGPNLSWKVVESEEWESDGGEGSEKIMHRVRHVWAYSQHAMRLSSLVHGDVCMPKDACTDTHAQTERERDFI